MEEAPHVSRCRPTDSIFLQMLVKNDFDHNFMQKSNKRLKQPGCECFLWSSAESVSGCEYFKSLYLLIRNVFLSYFFMLVIIFCSVLDAGIKDGGQALSHLPLLHVNLRNKNTIIKPSSHSSEGVVHQRLLKQRQSSGSGSGSASGRALTSCGVSQPAAAGFTVLGWLEA